VEPIQIDCSVDNISAFLDGELGDIELLSFESHLEKCSECSNELREQKKFLCELDFVLNEGQSPKLPENFVRVISTSAQSDMRGVRTRNERLIALKVSLGLLLISCLAIGSAFPKLVTDLIRPVQCVLLIAFHSIYNFAAGVSILSRSFGGLLLLESRFRALVVIAVCLVSATLLPRLISHYHRTR